MELIAALIVWAYGIFEYRCVNTNSKALHTQDEDITLLKIKMLRNDATHFIANLIKKTLQDKYLSDFLCLSQGFLVSGLEGRI